MKKIFYIILLIILVGGGYTFYELGWKDCGDWFVRCNTRQNVIRNNLNTCEQINDKVNKRACYINTAIDTNNTYLCNIIPYTQEEFDQITSGPIYQHSDITDCYRKIAKALKKPEICDQIDKFDKPLGTIVKDCKSSSLE